jgi:Cd2+/Zn2+-exporting ATPase
MNTELTLTIGGMDCASCAQTVEAGVARLDGVQLCQLNFTTETLRVSGDISREMVVSRVHELGYQVLDAAPDGTAVSTPNRPQGFWAYMASRRDTRMALLATLLILPGLIFDELLGGQLWDSPLIDAASLVAWALAGYPVMRSAWRAVRISRQINIDVLMTIAAIGAIFIGAYSEAAMVMVLFVIGEAIEGFASDRARQSIRSLMALAPNQATVLRPCLDCAPHLGQDGYNGGPCPFCGLEPHTVPVTELQIGETIVVKPGERIPMDGRILTGSSSINQAPITGESALIAKSSTDTVFASSINGEGVLEIEVTHLAADNTISRVIKMVEEAQEKRAPTQRFIDQFAKYYTPAVVVLAVLVAIIPPLFFDQLLIDPVNPTAGWLYRALALLVVACPCALVISTPVSIVSAISNGARNGVLFKGGAHLEELARVQAIAFDKTGTLTRGKPDVVAVKSVRCTLPADVACADCDDLLALATAVEQRSEHPLAHAILMEAEQRGVAQTYPAAANVTALTGRGVTGAVNGRQVTIGSHGYFDELDIAHESHCAAVQGEDSQGYTTMLVSRDAEYMGYIAVADTVRPSSQEAIAQLKQLGLHHLVMLTGDNEATAQQVAAAVGVTEVRANCLPADKVTAVEELRAVYGHVAMVGDGINDAPALATANVGIAIGNTAQAMETADITLMNNSLLTLPFAIRLSRAARSTIMVNIGLSLGLKLIFLLLVLAGMGTMWMAVLADMGTSLLVTLNGMRLLKRPSR